MERISATAAARGFSEVLNQVKYRGVSFEVERGNEVVARIVPAGPHSNLRISDLNQLFARLPALGEADALAFEQDIEEFRNSLPLEEDPWE